MTRLLSLLLLIVSLMLGLMALEPAWAQPGDAIPAEILQTDTVEDMALGRTAEPGAEPVVQTTSERRGKVEGRKDDPRWLVLRNWIREFAPPWMIEKELIGLAYWQWCSLFVFIFIAVCIDYAVQVALRIITRRLIREQGARARREEIVRTMRPIGLFAAGTFAQLTLRYLQFDGLLFDIVDKSLAVFCVIAGTVSAWRIIDLLGDLLDRHAAQTHTRFDDVLIPLLRKTFKLFILVLGITYFSYSQNINLWPLIASLGIGGVAFAFAAKDTVENFFGSIAVLLDRPFDIGDWVVIDDQEGTIESVGFRSTRIRTFYNSQITIPNANLVRAAVDNYGRRRYRRWKTALSLQYDTPPDKLICFAEGVRELVRQHPFTRKDYYQVWVNEFNASSIDVLLYLFFEVPDWSTELRERERLLVDIVRLADQIGVSFAFPTTTVHLYQEEGPPAYQQHEQPNRISDRRAMIQGIRTARGIINDQPWREKLPDPVDYGANDLGFELDAAGNPIEPNENKFSDTAAEEPQEEVPEDPKEQTEDTSTTDPEGDQEKRERT